MLLAKLLHQIHLAVGKLQLLFFLSKLILEGLHNSLLGLDLGLFLGKSRRPSANLHLQEIHLKQVCGSPAGDITTNSAMLLCTRIRGTLPYHTEMRQHISTLEAQQDEMHCTLTASVSGYTAPTSISYQEHYDKLLAHGHVVDHAAGVITVRTRIAV
jgi:hypothetical protein